MFEIFPLRSWRIARGYYPGSLCQMFVPNLDMHIRKAGDGRIPFYEMEVDQYPGTVQGKQIVSWCNAPRLPYAIIPPYHTEANECPCTIPDNVSSDFCHDVVYGSRILAYVFGRHEVAVAIISFPASETCCFTVYLKLNGYPDTLRSMKIMSRHTTLNVVHGEAYIHLIATRWK